VQGVLLELNKYLLYKLALTIFFGGKIAVIFSLILGHFGECSF
jgi:hypothetical protein